jgi:multisubunit Na+/H+ antiporter MnhB subunit
VRHNLAAGGDEVLSALPRTALFLSRFAAGVTCGAVLYGAFIAPNGATAQDVGFVVAFVASGVGLLTALVGAASTRPPRRRWTASALLNLALGVVALAVAVGIGIRNM